MDRGKPGSKMHILSDANGLPLLVGLSAANTHDSLAVRPMDEGHPTKHDPHRGHCFNPQRLHADKAIRRSSPAEMALGQAHRRPHHPQGSRVQRTLGRRRWAIERTMSWLSGYRRLNHRYERHPRNYLALLGLAAALTCYKRLIRLTT
ncbi:transposase [Streptomyces sp. NPDC058217]|uniref:transposase n=1 Tax=Streptomyces sp. NPDC058217 TaxID=3346384 RepID=UPI0036EC214C